MKCAIRNKFWVSWLAKSDAIDHGLGNRMRVSKSSNFWIVFFNFEPGKIDDSWLSRC